MIKTSLIYIMVFTVTFLGGCRNDQDSQTLEHSEKTVTLKIGHVGHDHHLALFVACDYASELSRGQIRLENVEDQKLYKLYYQDKKIADIQIVKPGGWVIAIEPKMGVEHEQKPCDLFGGRLSIPVPLGECKDISQYFEAAGLVKFNLGGAPECSYCYQKPQG